ncbi:hypothetical protein RYX36_005829 [Vicia faba]
MGNKRTSLVSSLFPLFAAFFYSSSSIFHLFSRVFIFFFFNIHFVQDLSPMSKVSNNASISCNQSFGTVVLVLRRNKMIECFCQDESVPYSVSDMNSVKYGRKFLGCRNYRNHMDKGCDFF